METVGYNVHVCICLYLYKYLRGLSYRAKLLQVKSSISKFSHSMGSNYCLFERVQFFTSCNIIGQIAQIADGSGKERICEDISVIF